MKKCLIVVFMTLVLCSSVQANTNILGLKYNSINAIEVDIAIDLKFVKRDGASITYYVDSDKKWLNLDIDTRIIFVKRCYDHYISTNGSEAGVVLYSLKGDRKLAVLYKNELELY